MIVDLRSDTVTRPTEGMLKAMFSAPVGDDVLGDDPSVQGLEAYAASLFGMESALFCPSGTMTNQIAIAVHCRPGDEVICHGDSHVYQYEGGGIAATAGASVALLPGERGMLTPDVIRSGINADDVHKARTALICLENTTNRGGGACYELQTLREIRDVADENGLALHLDGARLFNAMLKMKQTPAEMGAVFHSISICLSKGLGAPVGSLLLGSDAFIAQSRRVRKRLGGGMRQAGYLAAAGQYALEHHVDRLAEDHSHAALLARAVSESPVCAAVLPVETNIVLFELAKGHTSDGVVAALRAQDIWCYAMTPSRVRLVTHLDVSRNAIELACTVLRSLT